MKRLWLLALLLPCHATDTTLWGPAWLRIRQNGTETRVCGKWSIDGRGPYTLTVLSDKACGDSCGRSSFRPTE